jgi:hypothetical protein
MTEMASREVALPLVPDTPPQSLTSTRKRPPPWKGRRADDNPAVVSAQVPRLKQTMETARSGGVDFVFIDTAGRKDDSALSAARCSDLVFIPTRTSILEIETLPTMKIPRRQFLSLAVGAAALPAVSRDG